MALSKIKKRLIGMAVLILLLTGCILLVWVVLVGYGRMCIMREGWASGVKLKYDSIYPSWSYYFYITYQVEGDSELSRAYWCLKGGQVDVEK
jgi:hypothetical protein